MFKLLIFLCLALFGVMFWAETLPPPPDRTSDATAPEVTAPLPAPEEPVVQVINAAAVTDPEPSTPAPAATPEPSWRSNLLDISRRDKPLKPAEIAEARLFTVTGNRVNLRGDPSTRKAAVGALARGDKVAVIAFTDNGWAQIRALDDGQEGYMAAKFLAPVN